MKIHIVKKGDTLWKIAEMYGVDFEELKEMNAHLAHPDMIMPGMKIRVPVHKKETKKEHKKKEEQKVPKQKEMPKSEKGHKEQKKKPQTTKPMEEIKEDDDQDHIHIQPVMPFEQQKSPSLNKNTMPKMPSMPEMPYISPMEEEKEIPKQKPKEKPKEQPKQQLAKKKEKTPPQKMESDSMPLTSHGCYCYCGTCSPMHFEGAQMMPQMPMHMMHPSQACGCHQQMVPGHHMMHGMYPMQSPMMEQHPMQGQHMQQQVMPEQMQHQMQGNMQQSMQGQHMQQPMPLPYYDNQPPMQQPPYQQTQPQGPIPESWHRENATTESGNAVDPVENQPIRQSYPPMYSESAEYTSYPEPPAFLNEE